MNVALLWKLPYSGIREVALLEQEVLVPARDGREQCDVCSPVTPNLRDANPRGLMRE